MSSNINDLLKLDFPDENPLISISGEPERMAILKNRLLQSDVVLCVNDKCHLFSWAGEHCEKCKVPTLNLCPSQHEIQRAKAGVLSEWQQIFSNISCWPVSPTEEIYTPVRDENLEVPLVSGLYITYSPLLSDKSFVPAGREVVGPVYMSADEMVEEQNKLHSSGILDWIEGDELPVIYVSLGSMVRKFTILHDDNASCVKGLRALFKVLLSPKFETSFRILTTIPKYIYSDLVRNEKCPHNRLLSSSWVPQFAILGHPLVKAFVSHCGANSVHEAIYHGVPIIAIPFFDDQRYNGPRLVELGLASASLSKENMTEVEVEIALQDAMTNEAIRENMRKASAEAKSVDGLRRLVIEAEKLISFAKDNPHIDLL